MSVKPIPFETWASDVKRYNNAPSKAPDKLLGLTAHWQGTDIKTGLTVDDEIRIAKSILAGHLAKVNPKTGKKEYATIAYNWLIFQSGRIYEARGRNVRSAAQNEGNAVHLGVCFVLDDNETVSEKAQQAFIGLRDLLLNDGVGPQLKVHKDWNSTACPGPSVTAFIRSMANNENPGSAPKPSTPSKPSSSVPAFPLPAGHWYGKPNKNPKNHSGFYWEADRPGIKIAQRALGIKADGQFGEITEMALRKFQQSQGLRNDGLLGPISWGRLMRVKGVKA